MTSQLILQQYWNYSSFRGEQEKIIDAVLEKKDVLALLPTGGGKSVCFQVPALMNDGLCLVISPLIALMKDQVENLLKRNIPAIALHSGMSFFEVKQTLQNAVNGDYKFLYLSPERLETNLFKEYLHSLNINLIAVDEAHCISQWGYDFRPPYLRIANLREELPNVPVIALTASATPLVQQDIIEKLKFKSPAIFLQSFEKPNLSFSVFKVESKINKVMEILTNVQGSGIIYCRNRRQTKKIAELLQLQNIVADFYHAGLTQEERNNKQTNWINNNIRIIVCTNAFGMGIDKPDVRTVIHYDVPDCLENYYQEAGRGGRDGKRAFAVLLYQSMEEDELKSLPDVRFPLMYDIRKVYQSLVDYLQIPIGLGEGKYYDFDLNEFIKNFKLDVFLVINVLKVLEQEGHLSFNETVFLPAKVQFIIDKNVLHEFEQTHAALEPLIKCLLRTYEGIYDNKVSIFEKQLAKLIRANTDVVKEQLQQLQSLGIIEYLPQKETPQIYFITNRASASSLHINHKNYLQRKQQYELRIETMLKYLHLETKCRSKFIAGYFGDNHLKDCGICDNCLKQKNTTIGKEEFEKIALLIEKEIDNKEIKTADLLHSLKRIKKDKLWKVLQFLQDEKTIVIDNFGTIKKV